MLKLLPPDSLIQEWNSPLFLLFITLEGGSEQLGELGIVRESQNTIHFAQYN